MGQEFRKIHTAWLQRKSEEEKRNTFGPKDPPTPINIVGIPSSIFQEPGNPFNLHGMGRSSDPYPEDRTTAVYSPTLSTSTASDLTPSESDEDTREGGDERILIRHKTFYLEDGNMEIVCGHTIFRVHSPIVSFSSPTLRNILSPSALCNAPTPEGCPQIIFKDSAEDFAVLLKMIYTPG